VAYDAAGRVFSVTQPAPRAGAAQPQHSYAYGSATTDVRVAGLTSATGYARRVGFDATARTTTDRDTAGLAISYTYDAQSDRVTSVVDPTGTKTVTVYDWEHRPTTTYGPAPSSWFSGMAPLSCSPSRPPPTTKACRAWPPPTGPTRR
jgi:uncharacterized protein RhaS with RHS repeats